MYICLMFMRGSKIFLSLKLCADIGNGIGLSIFLEIGLRIAVNPKVREDSLVRSSLSLPDIGHLNGLFAQLPLVPVVIRVQVLLDKVRGRLDRFVQHEPVVQASLYCLVHQTELYLHHLLITFLKVSSSRRNSMSSGFLRHCWITPVMQSSGSFRKSLMASMELKTQFFYLYLQTPKSGSPGINSPFFLTIAQMQQPTQSQGFCIKSGEVDGMNISTPLFGSSSIKAILFAFQLLYFSYKLLSSSTALLNSLAERLRGKIFLYSLRILNSLIFYYADFLQSQTETQD